MGGTVVMNPRSRLSVLGYGGGDLYAQKVKATQAAHLIAYWPLSDGSGTTAVDESGNSRDATYKGVTLGEPGIGDGRTCPYFDGANDAMNIQIASLSSAFSWQAGSVSLWAKYLDTSVWSDGSTRWWFKAVAPQAKEFLYLRKSFQANMVSMWLRVNSADFAYSGTIGAELGAAWFHVGVRWDCSQGKLWMYVKGTQRKYSDTLGTPADATGFKSGDDNAVVGAGFYQNPAEEHNGWLAHVALWDTCLSADELLALAEV